MNIRRFFNNLIGRFLHYKTCPNCGDSFWLKPCQAIIFRWKNNIGEQVKICTECFNKPRRLNKARIKKNLIKAGWPQDETVEQAGEALATNRLSVRAI